MKWKLIQDTVPRDGRWNMAVDERMWRRAEQGEDQEGFLRIYEWHPPCLSLGYHQVPEKVADLEACRRRGFDVVRRPTGGKAVLHQDEITYCIVAPQEAPPFDGGLESTYGAVARALQVSLKLMGIVAALDERNIAPSPRDASPCFLVPSRKELLMGERKVVGSAQRRGRRAFLQHGSIPISLDYEALAEVTGAPASAVALFQDSFAGLAEFAPGIDRDSVRAALEKGFRATFAGVWEEAGSRGKNSAP